jgi:hypothetical protein
MLAVEWSQGIEDAWSDVAAFVPRFLGFLAVLLIGYLVVKAVAKVIDAALERTGFDRLIERGGIGRAMERTEYDASDVLSRLVFWGLMLIVLQMAFGVFGPNPISDLIEGVIAYLPRVLAAILIVVVAAAIAAAVREIIQAAIGGLSYGAAVANATAIAILVVAAFAALNQLRIAPAIVNGLFYAILAVVAGSAIIAIGGGGVAPMRRRWEEVLRRYDEEKPRLRQEMQGARERLDVRAQEVQGRARGVREEARAGEGGTARTRASGTLPDPSPVDPGYGRGEDW